VCWKVRGGERSRKESKGEEAYRVNLPHALPTVAYDPSLHSTSTCCSENDRLDFNSSDSDLSCFSLDLVFIAEEVTFFSLIISFSSLSSFKLFLLFLSSLLLLLYVSSFTTLTLTKVEKVRCSFAVILSGSFEIIFEVKSLSVNVFLTIRWLAGTYGVAFTVRTLTSNLLYNIIIIKIVIIIVYK
jgi:hypothetical protein